MMAFQLWLLSYLASTASSLVQGRKACTWLFQVSTFQQDPLISESPIWSLSFWLLDEDKANRCIEWSELCIHRLGLGALPPAPYACLWSCSKGRALFLTMQLAFIQGELRNSLPSPITLFWVWVQTLFSFHGFWPLDPIGQKDMMTACRNSCMY